MNKWIKFPLTGGIIFAILWSFFSPFEIWRKIYPLVPSDPNFQGAISIFSFTNIIDGLIIGIILGLIIALFKKNKI